MSIRSNSDTRPGPPCDQVSRDAAVASIKANAAAISAASEQFARDDAWLDRNSHRLIEEHPDEWVAVFGEKVIAHHADLRVVIEQIKELGHRPGDVAIDLMETTPVLRIL